MNQIEYDFRGREVFLAWDNDGDWWLMDPDEKEPIDRLTADEKRKVDNLVRELRMDWTETREPTPIEIASFQRAANALAKLGKAGLYIYLANSTLNLLSGPSHEEDTNGRARQDRVRAHVNIPKSGGGDW